uniref:Uncharacterized protein n=1 Tax=viral metagenome TaxID=1070528 RepID=A0A6M3KRN3_9ZZZZ
MARIDLPSRIQFAGISGSGVSLKTLREHSEQLAQFAGRDFSSIATEMRVLLASAHAAGALPPEQYFALVSRVAEDVARLYILPPQRDGLPAKLARVYKRSGLNTFMREVSERLIYQRTQIVGVDPSGEVDRIKLHAWSPFQAAVYFDDPMEDDIGRAERVELLVPLSVEQSDFGLLNVEYGKRVYTRTEAYVATTDGTRIRPIFGGGYSHRFGRVPLVAIRWGAPADHAIWFPNVADDLRSLQITVISQISQMLRCCEMQIPGKEVLSGPGARDALGEEQPSGAWAMKVFEQRTNDSTQPLEYQWVQGSPPIDQWIAAIDKAIELWALCNHVNPGVLVPSKVITGDGVAQERLDHEEQRAKLEELFGVAEQQVAELAAEVLATDAAQSVVPKVGDLHLDYRYVEPKLNDLQAAQARAIKYASGEDAPEKHVARRDSITIKQAEKEVADNRERVRIHMGLLATAQGVDKVSKAMPDAANIAGPDEGPPHKAL